MSWWGSTGPETQTQQPGPASFPQQAQEAALTLRILTVTQDWAFLISEIMNNFVTKGAQRIFLLSERDQKSSGTCPRFSSSGRKNQPYRVSLTGSGRKKMVPSPLSYRVSLSMCASMGSLNFFKEISWKKKAPTTFKTVAQTMNAQEPVFKQSVAGGKSAALIRGNEISPT